MGVVYLAFGARYQLEARQSIASLRRVSPNLPIAVITDQAWEIDPLPDQFILKDGIFGFECKPLYMEDSPFEHTLFIDTDTFVARDLTPVFGLLKHYDVGVRFGGPQLYEKDGLEYHTQCSSGVVLYRKNRHTSKMFSLWIEEYSRAKEIYDRSIKLRKKTDPRGLGNQRYLAIAIAKSEVRPVHLAEYLNFAFFENLVTYSPPAIFHGRLRRMDLIAKEINQSWDETVDWYARVWVQHIHGILPLGRRKADPILNLAYALRRLFNDLKRKLHPSS